MKIYLTSSALILFKSDPTLVLALDAAKVHIEPLEFLMRLWPCDGEWLFCLAWRASRLCGCAEILSPWDQIKDRSGISSDASSFKLASRQACPLPPPLSLHRSTGCLEGRQRPYPLRKHEPERGRLFSILFYC